MTDSDALTEFVSTRSTEAFAVIVGRYIDLVYSTARRVARDAHLAEDATQAVFVVLTRRADSVRPQHLAGWLVNTSRLAARKSLRTRSRRWRHEANAAQIRPQMIPGDEPTVDQISPLLDDALARLNEADRSAVVMRFLQGRSFAEVGQSLNVSEDAARKRVERATEKLRIYLTKQGFTSSIGGLTVILAAHQADSAPAQLANLVTTAPTPGGAAASIASSVAMGMNIAKIQVAIMAILIAVIAVGGAMEIIAAHHFSQTGPPAVAGLVIPASQRTTGPIQTNDRLSVHIAGLTGSEDSTFHCRVDTTGQIALPMIGQIQVTNLEPATVGQLVNKAFKDRQLIENANATAAFIERGDQITILSAPIQPGDHLLLWITDIGPIGHATVLRYIVEGNGSIYLPYLKKLDVAGLTEFEAEKKVNKAYSTARLIQDVGLHIERIAAKEFDGLDDEIKTQSTLLKPGDRLVVSDLDYVARRTESVTVTVSDNGTIDTPRAKGIRVAGCLESDAVAAVEQAYAIHHVGPVVNITIKRA